MKTRYTVMVPFDHVNPSGNATLRRMIERAIDTARHQINVQRGSRLRLVDTDLFGSYVKVTLSEIGSTHQITSGNRITRRRR